MKSAYYTEFSHHLNRQMEFKVFGHSGKPCLVFPSQNGRFFDFENYGMIDAVAHFVNDGRLQLFCVDSIDNETWSNTSSAPDERIYLHEQYFRYIIEEIVPRIHEINSSNEKIITTGVSMGGFHATNIFFRHPDIFSGVLSMSGVYNTRYFFGDYIDETIYLNSVEYYMRNMPYGHPYRELFKQSNIILCVGQGKWENESLESTRALEEILKQQDIYAWVNYWGFDVDHNWNWWKKQFAYYMQFMV